jgi:MYXO-CTERM domain-containing protein
MNKLALLLLAPSVAAASTLEVGPGKTYAAPCAAFAAAQTGDTVTIDAAGSYDGDVCPLAVSGLTVRGVNGRPHIDAAGHISQGKAIWVVSGDDAVIEDVELSGCRSATDLNGAAIRSEGTNLTLRRVSFHDNDDGILTNQNGASTVTIEDSEFFKNGAGDGYSHNLYIGHVAKLVMTGCDSHDASVGHLVKSRAAVTELRYNRFWESATADSSYEINLPNGGVATLVGNVIVQGPGSQNSNIVDFGSEGAAAGSQLTFINNTVVNQKGSGTFLNVNSSVTQAVLAQNNIFAGPGTVCSQATAVLDHNYSGASPGFVDAPGLDFHLTSTSPCIDQGTDTPGMGGASLAPTREYVAVASTQPRAVVGTLDEGAYEYGVAAPTSSSTAGTSSSAASSSSGAASTSTGSSTGASTSGTSSSGASTGTSGGATSTSGSAASGTSDTGSTGSTGVGTAKGTCSCAATDEGWAFAALLAWAARRRRC